MTFILNNSQHCDLAFDSSYPPNQDSLPVGLNCTETQGRFLAGKEGVEEHTLKLGSPPGKKQIYTNLRSNASLANGRWGEKQIG